MYVPIPCSQATSVLLILLLSQVSAPHFADAHCHTTKSCHQRL